MKKATLLLLSVLLLLILAACGTDSDKAEAKQETAKEETPKDTEKKEEVSSAIEVTDASGESITFESAPESIAALNSGDLDILIALGANVTGRPTASGPVAKEIESITEIGNPHQPNFEKLAEVHPTVLAAAMSFKQHAENVERQGTKVIYTKANSIADIQETIRLFGQLFQKEAEAETINKTITEKVENGEKVNGDPVKTLLVYGAPGTYLAALPNSLTGDLLAKAGGENIASDFPQEENYPQYASLSVEKIIERNPEVVMLITHGDPEAVKAAFEGEMEKNAAWKNLDAVKSGNVFVLPSNLFGSNPGTKVVEALEVMKENLAAVK
ncbi:ABC transporter substrate-binding protein [Sporosarcina sp. ANT_H38]|uniref:ABC transporter substrate-binding protein n=1 Tax=Sporosarcina sp. ANT_H38 TaxID=2597358 RepID=UPI0011F37AA5|nr:ABC transporter substrate-binding protein [Sporosarcina sp. ANT_H38]KAA0955876.1 ABC transporter substrate-binding protein [Sporosarcina sp. ANT_H38]